MKQFLTAIKGSSKPVSAVCKRTAIEEPTRPNCVITPSEAYQMVQKGIPVSLPNRPEDYSDGDTSQSWDIPIERLRGVDVNDIFEATWNAREKIRKSHIKDKEVYG